MVTTQNKISTEYFNFVEINVDVDDLKVIIEGKENVIIDLTSTSNLEEQISKHFINHNRYNVNLKINGDTLYINYIKQDIILLDDINYVEMIGCHIKIPEGINYKIIENGKDKD